MSLACQSDFGSDNNSKNERQQIRSDQKIGPTYIYKITHTYLDILIFLYITTFDPEHASLGIKVNVLHRDSESRPDPVTRTASCGGLGGHLTYRRRAEAVSGGNKVICVPHVFWVFRDESELPV